MLAKAECSRSVGDGLWLSLIDHETARAEGTGSIVGQFWFRFNRSKQRQQRRKFMISVISVPSCSFPGDVDFKFLARDTVLPYVENAPCSSPANSNCANTKPSSSSPNRKSASSAMKLRSTARRWFKPAWKARRGGVDVNLPSDF